jgi:hypothetical protein
MNVALLCGNAVVFLAPSLWVAFGGIVLLGVGFETSVQLVGLGSGVVAAIVGIGCLLVVAGAPSVLPTQYR